MQLKVWPLFVTRRGADGLVARSLRVVLLNKRGSGACRVVLRAPAAPAAGPAAGAGKRRQASVQWLLPGGGAPASAAALTGGGCGAVPAAAAAAAAVGPRGLSDTSNAVSMGGQRMDSEGLLQPAAPIPYALAAPRAAGGGLEEYSLTVPGASGALVTIHL